MATDIKDLANRLSSVGAELKRIADLLDNARERQKLGVDKAGEWPLFQQTVVDTETVVKRLEDLIDGLDT